MAISNQDKVVYKDLSSKYKQLFKQNVELRKMLKKREEQQQLEKEQSDKTIKHLSNTIQLLELNLKQLNSRLQSNSQRLTELSSNQTKPIVVTPPPSEAEAEVETGKVEVTGLSEEFQTPDSSKAIKTVPLLPNTSSRLPEKKAARASQPQTREPIPVSDEDSTPVFVTGRPKSAWEDPDLAPPSSPIKLRIVPGAKRKYHQAFKTYSNRDFKKAIKLFKEFVKKYPSDRDADNSQYWIGQAYYQLEEFVSAEKAFRKVLRNYPHNETRKGYKTPDAILMLGRIYAHHSKPVKGRYYYEQVIDRFPNSRSAAKAKREIQAMSSF